MKDKAKFKASENLADQIAHYISEKIIFMELKPGERILEAKLADELGVSRAPLREALRILEKHRLVDLIPRRGAKVSVISEEMIIWLFEVLLELYAIVARKVVENGTERDFAAMQVAIGKLEKFSEAGDASGYLEAVYEYAEAALRAAKNPLLGEILLDLWPASRRLQFASLRSRSDELKENVKYFDLALKFSKEGNVRMVESTIRDLVENEIKTALKMVARLKNVARAS